MMQQASAYLCALQMAEKEASLKLRMMLTSVQKGKINFGTTIYLQKHSTTYITHKVQCNMLVLNTEMVAKGSKFLYCQALRKHTYSIITFVTLIHLRERAGHI